MPETSVGAIGRSTCACLVDYKRRQGTASSFCRAVHVTQATPSAGPCPGRVAVVIGGAGFLGSRLVEMMVGRKEELEAKGHAYFSCIRVLDRSVYTPPPHLLQRASGTGQSVTWAQVDVVSYRELCQELKGAHTVMTARARTRTRARVCVRAHALSHTHTGAALSFYGGHFTQEKPQGVAGDGQRLAQT